MNSPLLQRNEVYNVSCGDQITLNDKINALNEITGQKIQPIYREQRVGDVRHSKASIEKIKNSLDYEPKIKFREVLNLAYDWYLFINA